MRMNRLIAFAMFTVLVAAMLAPDLKSAIGAERPVPAADAAQTRPQHRAYAADVTVLDRDASGQFHMTAAVNGQDTRFLVDTGADVVALTVDEAERLGLGVRREEFQPIMQTASGVGYGAPVTIDRITIGDDEFRDVEAVVVDGLGTNLLGQSVLRRLGKVELQGDRMILRHS